MADLTKTVKILFQGDDEISPLLNSMSKSMDAFGSDLGKIGDPFTAVTKGVLALDAAILALAVGGVAVAVNAFASFEDKMLKVKGVLGANNEEYIALTALTKDLGATTRFTADQAAEGLQFLALAGLKTADAMEALPEVLNLAAASALDLGTASDIVTNIMAGFGIATSDLVRTNDVLTATFTNSNTSLEQLGQAFQYVGPVAKSLGFSLEETSAALGILGTAGYQAEKGGTALRNIMLALVAPAGNMGKLMKELGVDTSELGIDFADSRNALDSLGVTIKDSNGDILGFTEILGQIKSGLEDIPDPADRTATLIEIFGKRGGPQLAALLEQGTGAIDGLEDKIGSLGGITKKIADEMESGIGGSLRAVASAFDAIAIEIGENAAAAIKPGVTGVTDLFTAIAKAVDDDAFKPLFDALGDFGSKVGVMMANLSANLPEALKGVDYSSFIESIGDLADELGGMFDGVDLGTPEGLARALQVAVDSLDSLVKVTTSIVGVFKQVPGVISGIVDEFNDLPDAFFEITGLVLGVGTAFTLLSGTIIAGGALVSSVGTLVGLFSAGGSLATALTSTKLSLTALMAHPAFAVAGSATAGWAIGSELRDLFPAIDEFTQKMFKAADGVFNFSGQAGKVDLGFGVGLRDAADAADTLAGKLYDIPDRKSIEISTDVTSADWAGINAEIGTLTAEKTIVVDVDTEPAMEELSVFIADTGETITIMVPIETSGAEDAKKEIDDIPTEKILELKIRGDIDKQIASIVAQADTAQAAFEWTAKVDIAEVQAAAEVSKAAFDGIAVSVDSLAESTSSMFGDLLSNWEKLSKFEQTQFTRQLEKQTDLEAQALASQIELNNAQIANVEAQTAARGRGDSLFTIDTTGLEPALDMIFWQIIEKAQIRGTEENPDFVL